MQISPVQYSFTGRFMVKCNTATIDDLSGGNIKWRDEAGPAFEMMPNSPIAVINSKCVSKISGNKIIVKDSPNGKNTYFIDIDYRNPIPLNTLLNAYNAACQKTDITIDTTL